jgi:PPM family protein phosphatase
MPDPSEASPPALLLSWSALTHPGKVRKNNEDAFLALTFDGHELRYLGKLGEATLAEADFVFAVSDGMGGARAGEFASRIAVDRITQRMPQAFRLSAMGLAAGFGDVLQELLGDIHKDLLALGQSYEECKGMGTTLSLAWFHPGWLFFCHVGDSRIYYLPRTGGITQLTRDDTHVGWLRRQGKITEREARIHPRKNALQQALGANQQFIDPQVGAVGLEPGDRFLLCTDGVIDGLWDHHLEDGLRRPDEPAAALDPARRLVTQAVDLSGADNATAVVIEVLPPPAA